MCSFDPCFSPDYSYFRRVSITSCLTHFGHETDVEHLPLPDDLKTEIANLLRAGFSNMEIVEKLRSGASENDRAFYVKRYEVKNVLARMNKDGGVLEEPVDTSEVEMEARRARMLETVGGFMQTIQYATDPVWLENAEAEFLQFLNKTDPTISNANTKTNASDS
ncbi:hypothetical protein L596_016602 [Steinernema carpocapsae]|uniref:Uncharacterized protein n=1 Tax=Steinernema carpocapsae TaxID=34508 RepID=A0A4U5NJI1_STECR|nr:hypothetical protein L596_016602 [Steinernema carpocapsae]